MKKKEDGVKIFPLQIIGFCTLTLLKAIGISSKKIVWDYFQLSPIKIAALGLSKTVFEIVLALPEAEICRFFMLHLAWMTLYLSIEVCQIVIKIFVTLSELLSKII